MNSFKRILLGLLALIVFSSISYGVENEPSLSPSRRREGTGAPTLSAEPPSSSPDAKLTMLVPVPMQMAKWTTTRMSLLRP